MHLASLRTFAERYDSMVAAATKILSKMGPRITVSLSQHDHVALSALAEHCNVSLSWLTRQAIAEFLVNHPPSGSQLPLTLDKKASQ
jgi:hypothetical protein